MKIAQAVLTQTVSGQWKLTLQSARQVERGVYGDLDLILKELKQAAGGEWERWSKDGC